jgi:tetratricopeptide (TPR) repeat protein
MGERAIELDPNSPEGYTLLSVANVCSGNPEVARLLLEGVKNSNPWYRYQVSSIQALSNLLLGNHQAALDGFSDSLSIDPSQIQSYVYKTIVLYRMGQSEDARVTLNKLFELHPGFDAQAWARRQPFVDKRIIFSLLDDLERVTNL